MQLKRPIKSAKNRQKSLFCSHLKQARQPNSTFTPYKGTRTSMKSQINKRNTQGQQYSANQNKKQNISQKATMSMQILNKKQIRDSSVTVKNSQQKLTMTQPNDHQLRYRFDVAVEQVYSILDIFNRGTITQANITIQIPTKALYFLGEAFQKIRISRKPVKKSYFIQECVKLFRKSAQEDLLEFIKEMRLKCGDGIEKQSVEEDRKNTLESQVQHKLVFQTGPKDPKPRKEQIISFKGSRQRNQKKKTLVISDEQNFQIFPKQSICKKMQIKQNEQVKKSGELRHQNIKGVRYKNQKKIPSPLVEINNFQNCAKMAFEQSFGKATDKINNFMKSNFEKKFHEENSENEAQKGHQSPCFRMSRVKFSDGEQTLKCEEIMKKYRPTGNYPNSQKVSRENTEQKISFSESSRVGEANKVDWKDESSDKLDRLSNRLEDYIKQNALRLERSKNARVELE